MTTARWSTTIATASFAAVALAVVWGVSRDLRPGPLYATTTSRDWLPVVRDEVVVLVRFILDPANLSLRLLGLTLG